MAPTLVAVGRIEAHGHVLALGVDDAERGDCVQLLDDLLPRERHMTGVGVEVATLVCDLWASSEFVVGIGSLEYILTKA